MTKSIKKLEWEKKEPGDGSGWATHAYTAEGIYDSYFQIFLSTKTHCWRYEGDEFVSEDAAKLAAQKEYERVLRSAYEGFGE